jgi:hypothetical protein
MDWTIEKLLLLGSLVGGFVAGLIKVFGVITARLDARRKRIDDAKVREIATAVEVKKLQADTDEKSHAALIQNLWQIIESKNDEIAECKREIEELEKTGKLTRPVITKINAKLRAVRREVESLAILISNAPEAEVFMQRFATLNTLLDQTEELLP